MRITIDSRWKALLGVAVCGLTLAASAAGPAAATPGRAQANDRISLLFVLDAPAGTLTKGAGNNYTLTLNPARPRAVAFSDAPQRITAMVSTEALVGSWATYFPKGKRPNAALNLSAHDAARNDTVVMELGAPAIKGAKVTFPVKLLVTGKGRIASFNGRTRSKVPSTFRDASLFIDDVSICGTPDGGGLLSMMGAGGCDLATDVINAFWSRLEDGSISCSVVYCPQFPLTVDGIAFRGRGSMPRGDGTTSLYFSSMDLDIVVALIGVPL